MYCKNCGKMIPDGHAKCESCGWEVPHPAPEAARPVPAEEHVQPAAASAPPQKITAKWSVWCWLAAASLCCSFFTLYMGLDKMFRYDSGDAYPHNYVNAYVGGDAYNYIINGTYATAFFVLTAMFVLAAIGLVVVHYVSQKEER